MSNHAFLSPSFGNIGYSCPASAIRSFQVKQRMELLKQVGAEFYGLKDDESKLRLETILDEDNQPAVDGTALHEVFEKHVLFKRINKVKLLADIQQHKDISFATSNDAYMTNSFYELVKSESKFVHSTEWFSLEHRVKVKGLPQFGTMDVVAIKDDVLYIRDLKTGRNEVKAQENYQLMTYAIGILDELGWDKFKKVEITILGVQFESDTWITNVERLLMFKDEVMLPAFMEAYSINPRAIPGDHCLYCVAKISCNKWQSKLGKSVEEGFESKDLSDVDNESLVNLFKLCKQAENLIKNQLKSELLQRFEGFDEPAGIKRVTGSKKDIWVVDDEDIIKLMKTNGVSSDKLYKQTLLSPKQIKAAHGEVKGIDKLHKTVQNKPYLKL